MDLIKLFFLTIILVSCSKDQCINEEGNLVPKTADQDSSIPSVLVNNAKLHSEAFGPADSAMIVVLHGGPGSDYRYLLNCKDLSNDGYRVVFYDQRGAGLSQRFPKSTYTMQVLYDDLSAIISHYRKSANQKVFLLGHSWGAMLAAAYINQYPTNIDGVVLAEPGGLVWHDVSDYISRSQGFGLFSETLSDAVYFDQFITGKEDEHAILDYKLMLMAEENPLVGNEGRLLIWRNGAVTFNAYRQLGDREKPDWTKNLHLYTTKVLFMYSENNINYGLNHAIKVSSPFFNKQLYEVKQAGHDMFSFSKGWANSYPIILNYYNSLK